MRIQLPKKSTNSDNLMKIHVSSALGTGPTQLSAFDNALIKTGVANYNLLRLSSVIPPDAEITEYEGAVPKLPGKWGDRLYAVYAETRTSLPSEEAWAGIGWVQDPETGQGLFVEHEGHSEQSVKLDITKSLHALLVNRGLPEMPISMNVVGGVCVDLPICAFAVAVYQVSDWQNSPQLQ